ncbi:hypothetical protein [Hymenobacter sp. YC55]|uniref:hypothetical protein n=1 Tax=Hymenobacter sp. YC55 TaxID=3034019 RepID=UPI0023F7476D|nr:hypothetical protein [Hymenobacter sp. YC55]MDF7810939.1 hypothetical protein [Hymenobacter sp. YC55]
MRYEFREVTYKGKTIRFIKAVNFDSDGLVTGPINELVEIQEHIERTEPNTIVVAMIGRSDTAVSSTNALLSEYYQLHPRTYDDYYAWHIGEYIKP